MSEEVKPLSAEEINAEKFLRPNLTSRWLAALAALDKEAK